MISKEMKSTVEKLEMRFAEVYIPITIGGKKCFKLEDGEIISLGCMPSFGALVIEYADNADEAELNRFDDGDLFYPTDMSLEELFVAMRQEIEQ